MPTVTVLPLLSDIIPQGYKNNAHLFALPKVKAATGGKGAGYDGPSIWAMVYKELYIQFRCDQAKEDNPFVYHFTNIEDFNASLIDFALEQGVDALFNPRGGSAHRDIENLISLGIRRTIQVDGAQADEPDIDIFVICTFSNRRKVDRIEIRTTTVDGGDRTERVAIIAANGHLTDK